LFEYVFPDLPVIWQNRLKVDNIAWLAAEYCAFFKRGLALRL
jgi:hypothetical protein